MVAEVDKALSGLGFEKADFDRPLAELSGGQKNRAMLARADPLVAGRSPPRRADEPPRLPGRRVPRGVPGAARSGAYLVVTHDRRFLDRVAEEIVDLENGRLTAVLRRLHGLPASEGRADPDARRAPSTSSRSSSRRRRSTSAATSRAVNSRQAKGRRTKLERVERLEKPAGDTTTRWRSGSTRRASAAGASCARRTSTSATPPAADRPGRRLRAPARRADGDPRRERHGQDDAPEDAGGPARAARPGRRRRATTSPSATTTRSSSDLDPRRRAIDAVWDQHPDETEGAMRSYLARFAFRGRRRLRRHRGPLRRREGEADARRRHAAAAQPASARRADEPSRPGLARGARGVPGGLPGLDRLRLPRPGLHRPVWRPGSSICGTAARGCTPATTPTPPRRAPSGASGPSLRRPSARPLRRRRPPAAPKPPSEEPRPPPRADIDQTRRAGGREGGGAPAPADPDARGEDRGDGDRDRGDRDAALGGGADAGTGRLARARRAPDGAPGGARRAGRGVGAAFGGIREGGAPERMSAVSPKRPESAAIIAIGSEMLGPLRQDTNSLWLSARLEEIGIPVVREVDRRRRSGLVGEELDNASRAARLVLTTGGLGPTADDVTVAAVAAWLPARAAADEAFLEHMRQRFEKRGIPMPECNAKQADFIVGARVLENPQRDGARFLGEAGRDRGRHPARSALGDEGDLRQPRSSGAARSWAGASSAAAASCASPAWGSPPSRSWSLRCTAKWKDDPVTILAAPGEVQLHLAARGEPRARRGPPRGDGEGLPRRPRRPDLRPGRRRARGRRRAAAAASRG